jgi:hypothetical protein
MKTEEMPTMHIMTCIINGLAGMICWKLSGPALRHRHRGGLILTELRGGAVASRPEDVPSLLLAGILPHLKIVTMTVIEEIAPRALTHVDRDREKARSGGFGDGRDNRFHNEIGADDMKVPSPAPNDNGSIE